MVIERETPIRVGTSGYVFRDWSGVFYPRGMPQREWLGHYRRHFDVLELNYSFYRIPGRETISRLAQGGPENFGVVVKLPREITHQGRPREALRAIVEATEPLAAAERHLGFLAQFPYAFRNTREHRRYLLKIRRELGGTPLYLEFRHDSWLDDGVRRLLEELPAEWVNVDLPRLGRMLPPTLFSTGRRCYLRLHGRNDRTWWHPERGDRYDYSYSREQLEEWRNKLKEISGGVEEILVFLNNCHAGQAVRNALLLKELLEEL